MESIENVKSKIKVEHFVGGKRVKPLSKESYISLNPSTNESIASFVLGSADDIHRAVVAAREAFDNGPWPKMSAKERLHILLDFAYIIEENAEFLGTVESLDVGKLQNECIKHDIARASANIRFFARQLEHWHDDAFFSNAEFLGRKIKTLTVTKREPIGVAGLIVPWNSPLMLATFKLGPCLAAGNTCVVKPSPMALLSVLQLGEFANEAGIPEGVLNIIPGDAEAGSALVAHRQLDRISFTGSVATGKVVNKKNAEVRLAPVSLELGGKSPSIVFADADIDFAVKGVGRGIFRSQGQSCVAGSRLLLEEPVYDDFMEKLVSLAQEMKIGDQLSADTEIGPLITRKHLLHVERFIEEGKKEGATLSTGGNRPNDSELEHGNYLEPTIFEDVKPSMSIWREEIFGPVLSVMKFSGEKEAIELANDSSYGLSSTVWTSNLERALSVADKIQAGMTWINSHFVRDLRAPFGGVKESGVGSEGGRYSLEFYTKPKMVCVPYPE